MVLYVAVKFGEFMQTGKWSPCIPDDTILKSWYNLTALEVPLNLERPTGFVNVVEFCISAIFFCFRNG